MGTVVGSWRLRTIIILFVLLLIIYTSYGILGSIETVDYNVEKVEGYLINENDTTKGLESSNDFWSVVLGLGDFLSFGPIEYLPARFLMNLFTSICWIAIGYIGYTFIKEWIPLT